MTDAFTDDLFVGSLPDVPAAVFPVSRLVVDPERFEDDGAEPMAARGMGVIYERTSSGDVLRRPPAQEERATLLERFYHPHHQRLTALVDAALRADGHCLVVDGHSTDGSASHSLPVLSTETMPKASTSTSFK